MKTRMRAGLAVGVVLGAVVGLGWGRPAEAAKWSSAYINALPDEAFAIVEVLPDGKVQRHLPHHTSDGHVDVAHLRNAMSRLDQVRVVDPSKAERAREHLLHHYRELGLPVPGDTWMGSRPPKRFHHPRGSVAPQAFRPAATNRSARVEARVGGAVGPAQGTLAAVPPRTRRPR